MLDTFVKRITYVILQGFRDSNISTLSQAFQPKQKIVYNFETINFPIHVYQDFSHFDEYYLSSFLFILYIYIFQVVDQTEGEKMEICKLYKFNRNITF